ncbi:poly(A) polymerase [Trypanosoma vivax]|nr:poly(A) polymerase [Trypanosoma vivax]
MELVHGPTKPLEVPPPQYRDEVESARLYQETANVSTISVAPTLQLVEDIALRVVQRHITEPTEQWVRAYPFGSCGLAASVADSDLDMYGEYLLFPLLPPPHNSSSSLPSHLYSTPRPATSLRVPGLLRTQGISGQIRLQLVAFFFCFIFTLMICATILLSFLLFRTVFPCWLDAPSGHEID